MNRIKIILTVVSLVVFASACTDYCKILNSMIHKELVSHNEISEDSWNEIVDFITNNHDGFDECYNNLFSNNNLDYDKLEAHILNLAHSNRRVSGTPQILRTDKPTEPLSFKFYLESSVSVWYYDQGNVQGEFKHAVVSLLNSMDRVSPKDNLMYIVNTEVKPYRRSFQDFIVQNNIFAGIESYGDPTQTDFRKIFHSILSELEDDEVSIMVSDMIYSTPDMKGKTTMQIANEVEGLMQNVFNRFADEVSVIVIKLMSSFDGRYFYFDPNTQTERGFNYRGDRPYYLTFIAKNNTIKRFLNEDLYQNVRSFEKLNRYQNSYMFQSSQNQTPYFSFLINHPETRARFRIPRSTSSQITELNKVSVLRNTSNLQLAVGIDLSDIFAEEDFKLDIDNYIVNNDNFRITDIQPFYGSVSTGQGTSTHTFLIKANDISKAFGDINISLKKTLPGWISESSTMNDTSSSISGFENTTFAFEQMMTGIYKAFHPNPESETYFTINLKINR